jgi:hypothetical protein
VGRTVDVNQKWDIIKNNIKHAMEKYIPNTTIKRRIDDQPWFTDKCAIICHKKEKAWQCYRKNPTVDNKSKYNQLNEEAKGIYSVARTQYAERVQKQLIENANNPRLWWHIVNHVTGKGDARLQH